MPACKDLTGQKFNMLTVLRKTDKKKYNGAVVWECKCDCGNVVEVITSHLKGNRVKSCGCLNHKPVFEDLTGQKFGRLTAIKPTYEKNYHRSMIWECRCGCGNIHVVAAEMLKRGHCQSCGCLLDEARVRNGKNFRYDLTGKKFGKLTALYLLDDDNNIWKCKCDCGNECEVYNRYLLNGHTKSCGCLRTSYGEYIIEKLLTNNNIPFEKEKTFESCKFIDTNKYARFDFYVDNRYIIEFDGVQHYEENYFLNSSLEKIQEHDAIKNKFCFDNNIPIIRIPYYVSNDITLKDLLLETSSFILKEGN